MKLFFENTVDAANFLFLAQLDSVLVLPQTPATERAAVNLLQNWNYAPWENPL